MDTDEPKRILRLKTWGDVNTFDDITPPPDARIIEGLETGNLPRCPHLRKVGKTWYFCGIGVPEKVDETPSPENPVYCRHVGVAELQLHCMGEFDGCCYKSGRLGR
jgi:hypothetical protein